MCGLEHVTIKRINKDLYVIALFVPRIAGKDHAKVALYAAQELLQATGHGSTNEP